MAKSKTKRRFEQVPLKQLEKDLHKSLARRGSDSKSPNVVFETPEKKTQPYSVPAGSAMETRG